MEELPKRSKAGSAFTELIIETFRLNGELIRVGDILTKELGLTSSLWQVFSSVEEEPIHMSQIARNMGLTRQSVRRSVKILKEKGLIEFIDNPNHRRMQLIIATKKGKALLKQILKIQIEWSNETSKGVSVSALKDTIKIMQKMKERLSTYKV